MAAVAFAGTGVMKATALGQFTDPTVQRVKLNNGYTLTVEADQRVVIAKGGTAVIGPITQSELQQFWQDVAAVGLVH